MTFVLFMLSCAFEFLCGYIVMEGSLYFCNNPPIKISIDVHDATQEEIEAYEQSRKEGAQ